MLTRTRTGAGTSRRARRRRRRTLGRGTRANHGLFAFLAGRRYETGRFAQIFSQYPVAGARNLDTPVIRATTRGETAQIDNKSIIDPVGSPLVRVSFTKGMICRGFSGPAHDRYRIGHALPNAPCDWRTDSRNLWAFLFAAIALTVPVASTAARRWPARVAYGRCASPH
jgi:hypothetical protein